MSEGKKELEGPEAGTEQDVSAQGGQDDNNNNNNGDEFDPERALQTIRAQRESEKALEKALKEAQGKLAKLEAAEKKRAQAEMSEVERLTAQNKELAETLQALEQERQTLILRSAVERAAAALGFHNPADAYGLADLSGVEVDNGEVSGVDKALKALAKQRPYLIRAVEKPEIDSSKRSEGKQAPNRTNIKQRFGI